MKANKEDEYKLTRGWKQLTPVGIIVIIVLTALSYAALTSCAGYRLGTGDKLENLKEWKKKDEAEKAERAASKKAKKSFCSGRFTSMRND